MQQHHSFARTRNEFKKLQIFRNQTIIKEESILNSRNGQSPITNNIFLNNYQNFKITQKQLMRF